MLIRVAFAGVGGTDLAQRCGKFNPLPGSPPLPPRPGSATPRWFNYLERESPSE